jgi:phospholipid/cholesterol/gamma-HCH transport system ATP-binding protein
VSEAVDQPPIISLRGLVKRFGDQEVLSGLDLDLPRDRVSVIIGRSGGGKSVLLKHVIGLLKPDAGAVIVDGLDITQLSERQMAPVRRRFGMLFQEAALFDSMSVADNVAFPLQEHTRKSPAEVRDIVERKLAAVGLSGMGRKLPAELSGGMRKRAGLARALALDPDIVLFDEPTSGLDPVMAAAVCELITRTREESRATCVVISHDIPATLAMAHDISMLYNGTIIAQGPPDFFRDNPDPVVRQFVEGRADGPIQVIS